MKNYYKIYETNDSYIESLIEISIYQDFISDDYDVYSRLAGELEKKIPEYKFSEVQEATYEFIKKEETSEKLEELIKKRLPEWETGLW